MLHGVAFEDDTQLRTGRRKLRELLQPPAPALLSGYRSPVAYERQAA